MSQCCPLSPSTKYTEVPLSPEFAEHVKNVAKAEWIRERATINALRERREQGLPDTIQMEF